MRHTPTALAAAFVLWVLLATGCATAPGISSRAEVERLAADARAALEAGDVVAADHAWTTLLDTPAFGALPADTRARMLADAGEAALSVGELGRARDVLLRSVTLAPSDVEAWWRLAIVELQSDDMDAAAVALARIALTAPDLLDNLDAGLVGAVLAGADPGGLPRLDLLQALFDAGWTNNGLGVDYLWVDLAVLRADRGESAILERVVDRIQDPLAIVQLRMDKRFDALVDRGAPRFDVAAAMQRKLRRLRALSAANPRWLEARNHLGFALLESGDPEAALADTGAILAALASAPAGAPPFDDMDEASWVGNTRAIALRRVGRPDEAVAAMRDAARLGEGGAPNVSQVLNLGVLLCDLGRWQDAREAIAAAGDMSPYGRMVEASVAHCAAVGLRDQAAADEALGYIRAHRDDAEAVLVEALLAAGREDEAAGVVIGQLASPRARGAVLLALQDFREVPPLPGRVAVVAAWDRLVARPDVKAAVDRVGRIEAHPIGSDSGF